MLDPYVELGVDVDASRDEIVAAYRAAAKRLHPDARPGDAAAEERFKRVAAAYRVLGDPEARARFDAEWRAAAAAGAPGAPAAPRVGRPTAPARFAFDARHARRLVVAGVVLALLGVAAAAWVISLERRDGALAARGVRAEATVVDVGGVRKLRFTTTDGRVVVATESVKTGDGEAAVGSTVGVHYDRTDPTTIVADADHTGRDVTLWIVAVKLVLGGLVLAGYGLRVRRRAPPAAPTPTRLA